MKSDTNEILSVEFQRLVETIKFKTRFFTDSDCTRHEGLSCQMSNPLQCLASQNRLFLEL